MQRIFNSLVIKDLVYKAKAKAKAKTFFKAKAKAKNIKFFKTKAKTFFKVEKFSRPRSRPQLSQGQRIQLPLRTKICIAVAETEYTYLIKHNAKETICDGLMFNIENIV